MGLLVQAVIRTVVSLMALVGMTAGVTTAPGPMLGMTARFSSERAQWNSRVNPQITGITYFVDCMSGRDSNSGVGEKRAWKSVDRANRAVLAPGDALLFQGGCNWRGPLQADWNGLPGYPILIGALWYGRAAEAAQLA